MFNCTRIKSVEYYERQTEVSRRESLQYYTDNGTAEAKGDDSPGVWWTGSTAMGAAPHILAKGGEKVDAKALRRLASGRDPESGEALIQSNSTKRSVGYDCQLAAPKSVSVLWGLAMSTDHGGNGSALAVAHAVQKAHDTANNRAMQYAKDAGLIITRRGKGGTTKESVGEVAAAQYAHHTSRAGDPQLHTHNVLLNVCIRKDGTTGTVDNAKMLRYQGAIAAIYRAELASELKRTLGVAVSKDERNFSIDGVPDALVKSFSKRRQKVLEGMAELGMDGTAKSREAAQIVSFNTREDKTEQPPLNELFGRWRSEANAQGWTFETLLETVEDASAKKERDADRAWHEHKVGSLANGVEITGERPAFDVEEIKARAFGKLSEHHSTFEYRTLCKEVFEELQVHTSAEEAIRLLDEIEQANELVRVGEIDGEPVYSTPEIIERERTMLQTVLSMKEDVKPFDPTMVERVIAAGRPSADGSERFPLRKEQADGVRRVLSGDSITVLEGRAGAGKSFTLGAVSDAAQEAGFEVHGLAPSWKATGVLREDTKLAAEYARAITGWLNRYAKGEITLSSSSLIIVDEAGMVGLDQMAGLVGAAKASGARLILSGDSRQLQPVAAGAPMAAIARLNGSAVLAEIARQKVAWQREASMDFSTGRAKEALAEYAKFGNVRLHDDGEAAMVDLLKDYMADVAEKPGGSRLILASTNADATALNDAVRLFRRERGELVGDEITVEALQRGKNGRVVEIGFAAGDRIIIGETLTVGGEQFVNNSTGTLVDIRQSDKREAVFHIRWDDGRTLAAAESELIGYREEKDPKVPKLAHAYAMTVHASQGQTVDACYVYNGKGMGLESTYVAMTRHRFDAKMYVDASRIHDEIAASEGRAFKVQKGNAGTKQADAESEREITPDEIRAKLYAECGKSDAKKNVCDFQPDVRKWLGIERETPTQTKAELPGERQENDRGDKMERQAEPFTRVQPRGLGRLGKPIRIPEATAAQPVSQVAQQERTRIEKRATATRAREVPKPRASHLITPDERDQMVRVNLLDYVQRQGATLVDPKKTDGRKGARGIEYELRWPEGGKFVVTHTTDGPWRFWNRDDSAKGFIWDLSSWRDGGRPIDAQHRLRDELGIRRGQNASSAYSPMPRAVEKPLREQFRERVQQAIAHGASGGFAAVRQKWSGLVQGMSAYLIERGITADTQTRFASELRNERPGSRTNPGGFCVAHRDANGELIGYERKGPQQSADRAASGFASGGSRGLAMMGETTAPQTILVAEASIDGLSAYQARGSQPGTLVVSFGGTPSNLGFAQLHHLAEKHPTAAVHVAVDNDFEGKGYFAKVERVVREARGSGAEVVDARPPETYKDWNDAIRGRVWKPEEIAADWEKEAKAVAAQREREAKQADVRRADEERRVRELEERAARNRPQSQPSSGPRLTR